MSFNKLSGALLYLLLTFTLAAQAHAQQLRPSAADPPSEAKTAELRATSEMEEIKRLILEQQQELIRLRAAVSEQSRLIDELRRRTDAAYSPGAQTPAPIQPVSAASDVNAQAKSPAQDENSRIAVLEEQVKKTNETIKKQLGSLTFSGEVRLRYDQLYGQLNNLPNGSNPAIIGNELSTRQRLRVRVRLGIKGQIGKEFEWGIRFASGSYADAAGLNQTLTDFFNRKPFNLDNAYIAYSPSKIRGLRLQAGKFEVPWVRTEMTFDNDLQVEGVNEIYSRGFKDRTLKNLTFVAWQLPFLERNSAFVRNADGTVNVDESGRAGRDLALYGAQLRARLEPSKNSALTLSLSDLFFSGTQFITPVQFFGNQLLLPLTLNIPATANSPAQSVTAQVSISRDLLVAGAGNLGLSTASNNALNRDGRLSSGFNLLDLIARLDLTRSKRFPLALTFNFVTNTRARDVVLAGPGGADRILPNNENKGYWAEIQAGKQSERGDLQFGYTFFRIEKDAVLTPFNFSELIQQSDVRVQRLNFNYTVDPRVVLSVVGLFMERPNGLLGAFGQTPQGSLNRPTVRIQFDTTFRF
jgi:hypothetical protein